MEEILNKIEKFTNKTLSLSLILFVQNFAFAEVASPAPVQVPPMLTRGIKT